MSSTGHLILKPYHIYRWSLCVKFILCLILKSQLIRLMLKSRYDTQKGHTMPHRMMLTTSLD